MDVKLVVIGRDQGSYLEDMDNKTKNIKNRIFVFDRCSDDSEKIAKKLKLDYITTPNDLKGFQAGYARNLGSKDWSDTLVFLDGDRVPIEPLTEKIIEEVISHYDLGLFLCECDIRQVLDEEANNGWGLNDNAGAVFNQCFSAGLILSKKAVLKLRELCDGNIFHSDFNGKWGEEDEYLGDCVYASGLRIGYVPRKWSISGEIGNNSYFNFYEEDWVINNTKRLEKRKVLGLSNDYLGYPIKPKVITKEDRFCITPFREFEVSPHIQHLCDCNGWMQNYTDIVWDLNIPGIERILEYDGQLLFNKIRNKQYDFCYLKKCPFKRMYALEDLNKLRSEHTDDFVDELIDYFSFKSNTYQKMPYRVKLCYDLSCNLQCPSCRKELINQNHFDFSNYFETVKPLLKEAKELYLNGAGEVFFSKHYMQLLSSDIREYAPNLNKIWIHTNLLLFNQQTYERIFNKDLLYRFIVSIDGATKETYENIRKGGNWELLLKNLDYLTSLKKEKKIKEVDAVFTFQDSNYQEMEDFVELMKNYKVDRVVFLGARTFGYNNPIRANQKVYKSYHQNYNAFCEIKKRLEKINNPQILFGIPPY